MNPRSPASDKTHTVFAERWSTRSFLDKPISEDDLAALFEAARWSPSWMNNQPWVFLYADQDNPERADFEAIISEFNRPWASNAPVIGLIAARPGVEGFMARSAEFDTGAAAMALAIQATMLDLSVHMMGGIELDLAREKTGLVGDDIKIICGFAIGYRGDGSELSEKQAAREVPSDRMDVSGFAFPTLTPGPRPE